MINEIIQGNCLEVMRDIPDGSVDMILADLPYGTTACKWDSIIPFEPLWKEYERVIKERGAIVLTAAQPFTSALVMSNPGNYRHNWYWNKENGGSPLSAKYRPMSVVEDILVFGKKAVTYYPIMEESLPENRRPREGISKRNSDLLGAIKSFKTSEYHNEKLRYPKNLLTYNNRKGELNPVNRIHPTQKPVELFEYLIRTYTNEGELVLDNVIGSGTTAVAAINTGRNFIGIEQEPEYVEIARKRVDEALAAKEADASG